MNKRVHWFFAVMVLGLVPALMGAAQQKADTAIPEARALPIEEFIQLATANDTVFDEILIDHLSLNYRRDLNLPAGDIVLGVKGQHEFFLTQDREDTAVTFSLSKLFPYSGTDIELSYEHTPSFSSAIPSSQIQALISQPIAQNAFGHATRLRDKIIGLEIDIIRYQVVEAYEDYLASLVSLYYSWYSAYENMKIGQTSYEQNLKLLDNMNERARQNIALPVDVNKVKLLVMAKEENLIRLTEAYNNLTNVVEKAVRYERDRPLIPLEPKYYQDTVVDFERDYTAFTVDSRTYAILSKLERASGLNVTKNADDLLPSTNLLIGYRVDGDKWPVTAEENMVFGGLSVEWPLPDQVERAEYEVAKIEYKKTSLSNQNKYLELYTNLKNLDLQISRERELIRIADEKIRLAEAVLEDEARNYSFGKVSLNDYLDAVNRLDENKFNRIVHTVQLKKLIVEWLRLTDRLVSEKVLDETPAAP